MNFFKKSNTEFNHKREVRREILWIPIEGGTLVRLHIKERHDEAYFVGGKAEIPDPRYAKETNIEVSSMLYALDANTMHRLHLVPLKNSLVPWYKKLFKHEYIVNADFQNVERITSHTERFEAWLELAQSKPEQQNDNHQIQIECESPN